MPVSRPARTGPGRRTLLLAGGALGAAAAAGCGSGAGRPDTAQAPAGSGFPVTVEHKYGSTEVPAPPTRIVTVGLSDHDAVLALGKADALVGVTDWYGDYDHGVWPWAQDALGGAEPEAMPRPESDRPDIERVASLEPDLIIGLYSGITEEDYEALSAIAPTVAQHPDYVDWGAPWEEMTLSIGRALGMEDEAAALIEDVGRSLADARKEHPAFEGTEVVLAEFLEDGCVVRSRTDPRMRFLESLGFTMPEDLADMAGDEDVVDVSAEEFDLLDRDLLVWNAGWNPEMRDELADMSVYTGLDVNRDGRAVIIDDEEVSGALTWSTVLSLTYAVEKVAPMLAEALEGDGDTL
ncbi:iron-siderophore ABC transporter substrate-binding protein [Nocardiopsis sp. RSe5-2]|uniref:Iron-siderophore ABC transporter substrate-binding protein n=1 Tax=Nocardiopsis endophytica TaxID=3018445 RepID=A0ABT4TZR0_9ACTN|nr:iron-siderophore ABC transporter substrate-binding protein [Nocardiopsis endophytica]MDA2809720.1 iron-siderophore ABC transporter substrate-binding protein [Nocardiopsis endophytica]